jgi:hypothetical protein
MEAGTESVEWVRREFARADLRDKRLDRRLLKTAEHLARSPSSPINEACGMWHVACGMWHVACGMWHVACGMWHVACGMWHVACGMWHVVEHASGVPTV